MDSGIRNGAAIIADLLRRHKATNEQIWRSHTNYGIECDLLERQSRYRKNLDNFMARDFWRQYQAPDWKPPDDVKPKTLNEIVEARDAERAAGTR